MIKLWRQYLCLVVCCLGAIPSIVQGAKCMVLEHKICVDFNNRRERMGGLSRSRFKIRCDRKEGWVPFDASVRSVGLIYDKITSVRHEEMSIPQTNSIGRRLKSMLYFVYNDIQEPSLTLGKVNDLLTEQNTELPSRYKPKRRENDIAIRPDSLGIDDDTMLYHDCFLKQEKGTIANAKAEEGELVTEIACNYIKSGDTNRGGSDGSPFMVYQYDRNNSSSLNHTPVVSGTKPLCYGNVRCYYDDGDGGDTWKGRVACSANRKTNVRENSARGSWECPGATRCLVDHSVDIVRGIGVEYFSSTRDTPQPASSSTTGR